MRNKLAIAAAITAITTGIAFAQQTTGGVPPAAAQVSTDAQTLTALPESATTVVNYYKQNVYDSSDAKIGEISDVLVSKEGKVDALIIAVGGFLGVGEKDVAVPFDAVHATKKEGKWYLTMNATKDALQNARGYRFDKAKSTWEPV
jgi:sporulation protein YlmC with PRC-barrel domain